MFPEDRGEQLTPTPVGHFIGMLSTFLIPVLDGTPVNLADIWDPALALQLMGSDGLTVGGGPPYFATSLLDHPEFMPHHLAQLKYMGLGGASIPAAISHRLTDLGIIVYRSYGSTEHPSITGSHPSAPAKKRILTDGNPLEGVEIRLGPDGEIFSRGPDLCLGYTDDALTAERVRRGRLVSHRRHRRTRRRRLSHHHRPQVRHHHPRRRKHQCRRARGGATGNDRYRRSGRGSRGGRPPG